MSIKNYEYCFHDLFQYITSYYLYFMLQQLILYYKELIIFTYCKMHLDKLE